jgi:cyclase
MTTMTSRRLDRRRFLQAAGVLSGTALAWHCTPAPLLALQASPLEEMRNQIGAQPLVTTKLNERMVLLSGPGGNVVVHHGPAGMIVVDGFVKPAWPKLKAALAAIGAMPLKSLIDTHWHFDHADNNSHFRDEGAGVIAHENTKRRLMQSHDVRGLHFDPVADDALPTQTFTAGLTLNFNGEQIDLRHVAPAHTDTDTFVRFPKADVLHMGDIFFNGFYPFIDASTGGHINGMVDGAAAGLNIIGAQTKVVPGHGPLGSRGSLQAYHRMLGTVRDTIGAAKKAGKSLADVQAAKPTAAFDADWGKGMLGPDAFVELVYATVR